MKKIIHLVILLAVNSIVLGQESSILTFKHSVLGDYFHLEFSNNSQNLDFGACHSKNNYNGYDLFLDDMSPNPKFKGKKFFVKWGYKLVEVADPIEPWKTEKVKNPYIKNIELLD